MNSLTVLDNATKLLAEVKTIDDAKQLMDIAAAAEFYAKKHKLGEQAVSYAKEIKERAKKKLGEFLKKKKETKGFNKGAVGGGKKTGPRGNFVEPRDTTPTLAESGVSKKLSSEAQTLASLPEEKAEQIITGEKTLTQVKREIKEEARESRREENRKIVADAPNPNAVVQLVKFATILIDPPWDWGDEKDIDQLGRARTDYATMPFEEIKKLPVQDLVDIDCHLYLWITNRSLPKGFILFETWGFRYITALTWPKPSFGMGNYFRGQTEHILFGIRGSQGLKRKDASTLLPPWKRGPKGHSSKPDEIHGFIESCSPGPFLEMFSRSERTGWIHWGAECK